MLIFPLPFFPNLECTVAWGMCNHAFHLHCITRWLRTRQICPLGSSSLNALSSWLLEPHNSASIHYFTRTFFALFLSQAPDSIPKPALAPLPPRLPNRVYFRCNSDTKEWEFQRIGH
jgi:hypothetical protein